MQKYIIKIKVKYNKCYQIMKHQLYKNYFFLNVNKKLNF